MRSVSRLVVLVSVLAAGGLSSAGPAAGGTSLSSPGLVKAFTPDTINVGESTTLFLGPRNFNASALTGVGFTDSLPAGLVVSVAPLVTSVCGGTISAPVGSTTISFTGATLPGFPGGLGVCDFDVVVTATAAGVLVNTTSQITSNETSPGLPGSATLTVKSLYSLPLSVQRLSSTGRTVGFSLASASTVRFSLDRRITRTRYRRVGKFTRIARQGRNRVRIPSRLGGRRVGKGLFRLSARASGGSLSRRLIRIR